MHTHKFPASGEGEADGESEGDVEGEAEGLSLGVAEGDSLGVAVGVAEGLAVPEGLLEGLAEGVADGVGLGVAEGLSDGLADGVAEGVGDGVAEGDSDGEAEGVALGVGEGVAEGLSEGEADGVADGEAEGVADGDSDGLPDGVAEGNSEGDAEGVSEGLPDGVAVGLNCEAASILLYDEKNPRLYFAAATGSSPAQLAETPVPIDGSLAGTIFRTSQPLRLNNAEQDPRHYSLVSEHIKFKVKSLLGVPMSIRDRTVGVLEAVNKRIGRFDQRDAVLVSVTAAHASIALDNARLLQSTKKALQQVKESDQLKSNFLSLASQELRTPLGIIIGYSTQVRLVARHDRFGRGGDHTAFNQHGMAAVRITEANEDFARQHTAADDVATAVSAAYMAQNTRVTLAAVAAWALAPPAPVVTDDRARPTIGRGPSGYDTQLEWQSSRGAVGYRIFWREAWTPDWQHELRIGDVTEALLPNLSVDDHVFGVAAVGPDGHESAVAVYVNPARPETAIKTSSL